MLNAKVKAVIILSLLIIAIGVPVIFYAINVKEKANEIPTAIITSPSKFYVNSPVEFSGKNSKDDGFIVTYLWNFGDGHKSSGKYVNHTYMSVGNYTVTLTVWDNEGASNSTTTRIEIVMHEEKVSVVSVDSLYKNTNDYIGREIKVHGVFAYGRNYSFYMVNESGYRGLRVYCELGARRPDTILYGDELEVLGRFTVYKKELELKVENNTRDYVIIIGHGKNNSYANISPSQWENYNNSFVHFTGIVTDVYRSYKFQIGVLWIYVEWNATEIGSPAIGDIFEIYGFLTYYKPRNSPGYMEVIVRNGTEDLAKYIKSNYTNATVSEILMNTEKYNNTAVHISQCVVNEEYASWKFWISDENSTEEIQVYVEIGGEINGMIFPQALVDIKGVVSYYEGIWEIKIRNETNDSITVLNKPTYMDVSIPELLRNSSMYANKTVHSWGVVSWFYHNASSGLTLFGLYYEGKELTIVGFNGSNISSIDEGYHADVYGVFTSYQGEWEIKIEPYSYDFAIGKPQNYSEVNITQVLNNPLYYNNTLVHIPYSKIVGVYQTWKFWVSNSSSSKDIQVYVEKGGTVNGTPSIGLIADIWGMVTQYNGTWEIKIRNSTEDVVNIKGEVNYTIVSIDELLVNTSNYNNTPVYVPSAIVTYVYNASWLFYVSNNTSNTQDISVYVEKGANMDANVYVGAEVRIWAVVTQYNGAWELKIRNNTDDNVKNLVTVNYVNVTIEDLLNNTSNYNNTNVHVPNATVVSVYARWLFWVSNSTGNKDIAVYVESGVSVPTVGTGDFIEIYGNVTYHNGSYEIKIRYGTPDRINVIYSNAKYVNFSYIHEVDSNGTLIHLGEQVIVNGTVIVSPNVYSFTTSTGTKILKFYIEDQTGGVQVFGYLNYSQCNLSEGDVVQIRGTIDQFNGEAEVKVAGFDYITLLNHTSPVSPRKISTGLFGNWSNAEKVEGTLVTVNGTVTDKYTGSSFVKITVDDGTGGIVIFIRNSWGIDTSNISIGDNITVIGIVAQYDSSPPYTSGYEIMPRYQSDIIKINSTKLEVGKDVKNKMLKSSNEVILKWKIDIVLTVEDMWVH